MSLIPASSSTALAWLPAITPVPTAAGHHQNAALAELANHSVRDRRAVAAHGDHIALRALFRLTDRFRNFCCLALTTADMAVLIAHDYESGEPHGAAALDGLSNSIYRDKSRFQIQFSGIYTLLQLPFLLIASARLLLRLPQELPLCHGRYIRHGQIRLPESPSQARASQPFRYDLCGFRLGLAFQGSCQVLIHGRSRGERVPDAVVNDLYIDIAQASVNSHSGAASRTADLIPDTLMALLTHRVFIDFMIILLYGPPLHTRLAFFERDIFARIANTLPL